jgi:hypothetical protein
MMAAIHALAKDCLCEGIRIRCGSRDDLITVAYKDVSLETYDEATQTISGCSSALGLALRKYGFDEIAYLGVGMRSDSPVGVKGYLTFAHPQGNQMDQISALCARLDEGDLEGGFQVMQAMERSSRASREKASQGASRHLQRAAE